MRARIQSSDTRNCNAMEDIHTEVKRLHVDVARPRFPRGWYNNKISRISCLRTRIAPETHLQVVLRSRWCSISRQPTLSPSCERSALFLKRTKMRGGIVGIVCARCTVSHSSAVHAARSLSDTEDLTHNTCANHFASLVEGSCCCWQRRTPAPVYYTLPPAALSVDETFS